ncbi:PREDICTED: pentatricopeptide repeat-containing protein At4g35850, mitochondrial [Fragaria vesca subsp. vesca]|uniref:pentatricopeptide repeat-containing protein At4g35850, mitochondrial n=1 Tax=Fragaria vesca subsp. vesca TaxID=101020 RepID=UPI0002C360A3|nr:PREDICTED: pentatricopeptide repeat-containing protein At4g35850, mitochondrial [Fragaria vesca subsp. vesca]
MRLLRSISGASHRSPLLRFLGRRHLSSSSAPAQTEEHRNRNYASNVTEYNGVVNDINAQRRFPFLLRDVYDDMSLDGVQPDRDTFHSLILGSMKGARLQDAFYFTEQMKSMGLVPDVNSYNLLISLCGKCKKSEQAIQILEEMKRYNAKPMVQTYMCLLNACAASGRLDQVYAIVRDMTAAGLGLNKFCYAGLITALRNKTPLPDDYAAKIIEFVERSKEWSSVEASSETAQNVMTGITEEELYNMPTAEYVNKRGYLMRQLTVYHVAFNACADLRNVEVMEALSDMLQKEGKYPDIYILIQTMRCYLNCGDIDRGVQMLDEYLKTGRPPVSELYTTLAEGAMIGYTPKGMQIAQKALEDMNSRNFFLLPRQGSDLLLVAAGEKTGGYTTANYIWDLMQARNITPLFSAVEAYYNGLKEREIPADDPRLVLVTRTYENLSSRFRGRRAN